MTPVSSPAMDSEASCLKDGSVLSDASRAWSGVDSVLQVLGTIDPRGAAFELLPIPALIMNHAGIIVACNAAASVLVEIDREELIGRPLTTLMVACAGGEGAQPSCYRYRGGHLQVRAVPLGPPAWPSPTLLILNGGSSAAESPVVDSYPFFLDTAHEMRSLLLSFGMAFGELVQRSRPVEVEDSRLIDILQRSAVNLQSLLENLLDAASIGASNFTLLRGGTDLGAAVHEAVLVVTPLLGAKGQRIVEEVADEDLTLLADGQRLQQVLTNLLHNAIKYGPPGTTIRVGAARRRGALEVRVSDGGPGIPPEERSHLFERFYRGQAALNTERQGTGLGLSIAKAIVEAHGGTIGVASGSGCGTTFWFTLPLE